MQGFVGRIAGVARAAMHGWQNSAVRLAELVQLEPAVLAVSTVNAAHQCHLTTAAAEGSLAHNQRPQCNHLNVRGSHLLYNSHLPIMLLRTQTICPPA